MKGSKIPTLYNNGVVVELSSLTKDQLENSSFILCNYPEYSTEYWYDNLSELLMDISNGAVPCTDNSYIDVL